MPGRKNNRPMRYQVVDILRGVAIVLMVYFHFSFDLAHFGYSDANFYRDPYWLTLRVIIVSMFVFLVGVSLVLASRDGLNRQRYLKRLGLLLLFSLIITVNSYFMFPGRTIIIGILHFIALASVLGLLFLRLYWTNLILGIGLICLELFYSSTFFNQSWIHWLGLMTHKPRTEDYVPLIPWFGVVLLGIFSAQSLDRLKQFPRVEKLHWSNPLANTLALAGRHSLIIYVLHQPLLFGSLWLISSV